MDKLACWVSEQAGRPWATVTAFALILAWAIAGPFLNYSQQWQLVVNTGTTVITFLMVFLLQATQNRDGAAIQAKLDELIRASEARDDFIGIDAKSKDEIDEKRNHGR